MVVKITCRICHKDKYLEMTEGQYQRLIKGEELISTIFPKYTPGQRELLISGTCEECWEELFKDYE